MVSRLVFAIVLALVLLSGAAVSGYQYGFSFSSANWLPVAWAEDDDDDEDEDEDEEDDEDEDDGEDEGREVSKPVEKIVTTYQQVQRTIVMLDEKFKIDTDGDRLVDGLDPDPTVSQLEYFMDDDEDAVPNALDKFPGADDFFTFDDSEDQDSDGILDAFLSAIAR